jgi:hypothetical protein
MSIRLSKVAKDFNVGIQTLVESLQKKGVSIDSNPNTKISDEQYNLLVKEFSKDKNLKIESDRISQERHNKDKNKASLAIEGYESESVKDFDKAKVVPSQTQKKVEKEPQEIKIEIEKETMPRIKEVGRIDLDALNKKTAPVDNKARNTENQKAKQVEKKEAFKPKTEYAPAKKHEHTPENRANDSKAFEQKEAVKAIPQENEDKEVVKMQEKKQEDNSQKRDGEVFRLNKPTLSTSINVIGTIDLNAINQQTRPKKKQKKRKRKSASQRISEKTIREKLLSKDRIILTTTRIQTGLRWLNRVKVALLTTTRIARKEAVSTNRKLMLQIIRTKDRTSRAIRRITTTNRIITKEIKTGARPT